MELQSFWWQKFLRILLTLKNFPSLLSAPETNPKIAIMVFGVSPSIWRARFTMPSAVNLGSLEFTSLFPTWIIIFSGSFLVFVLFWISFPCFGFFSFFSFSANNLPFFLMRTLIEVRKSHVVCFRYSSQFIV